MHKIMISFDAEDDGKGNIFLMGFYDGYKYKSFESKDFKDLNIFRRAVIDYILDSEEKIFVAHNLEYDLSHIFQGDYLTCLDWYYSSGLIYAKFVNTKIRFIDSFHFSYSSLAEIGKQIKHSKQAINIENIYEEYLKNPDKVKGYNQTDCEITHKYMTAFYTAVETEFDFSIENKNTLASVAQSIYMTHFSQWEVAGVNYDERLLNAYYGGRVECFYTGKIENTIYEIDVNSMYPFVMQNLFPVSEFFETDKPATENYIAHIKVNVKPDIYIPVLPFRTNKLLFPAGSFETWVTNIELEKAIAESQIIDFEYIKCFNFTEMDFVFKKYIDYFYSKRKHAKETGNSFESGYYKRIMNHLYGRFALHKELKRLTRITPENINQIIPVTNSAGYMSIKSSNKSKNFALAIYVTSYARTFLFDILKKVNEKYDVLYCDTDSCYFTAFNGDEIQTVIENTEKMFDVSNSLGSFSMNAYSSGAFYNAKAYILNKFSDETKVKLKGIKKEYRQEYLETGKTKYRKPVRMRTALRSTKGISVNSWEYQEISRRGIYEKRKMIPVSSELNKTEPLIIG